MSEQIILLLYTDHSFGASEGFRAEITVFLRLLVNVGEWKMAFTWQISFQLSLFTLLTDLSFAELINQLGCFRLVRVEEVWEYTAIIVAALPLRADGLWFYEWRGTRNLFCELRHCFGCTSTLWNFKGMWIDWLSMLQWKQHLTLIVLCSWLEVVPTKMTTFQYSWMRADRFLICTYSSKSSF